MELSKANVIDAVTQQRARTIALCRSLAPSDWDAPALPGWRVREVVAHLVATDEAALTGRMLSMGVRPQADGGVAAVESWNEGQVTRWSSRSPEEIVAGLEKWGRRATGLFKPIPEFALRKRVPLPFGRVPLLYLGVLRVFDEYVHGEDIRRALKREMAADPGATMTAARMMLEVAVQQTPARIGAGTAGRVVLAIDGMSEPVMAADLAARTLAVTPSSDGAARVTCDPHTIVMVAAGRDAWPDAERAGAIKIEGDRAGASVLLDALRAV